MSPQRAAPHADGMAAPSTMSWQHITTTFSKCHKLKRCVWCGEDIPVHTEQVVIVGKMDGEFQMNRFHSECHKASLEYFKSGEECFDEYSFKRGSTAEEGK